MATPGPEQPRDRLLGRTAWLWVLAFAVLIAGVVAWALLWPHGLAQAPPTPEPPLTAPAPGPGNAPTT